MRVEIPVNSEAFKSNLKCIEHPEIIQNNSPSNSIDKISINSSRNEIKFLYRPYAGGSERLQIASNTQSRNFLVLKIKKNTNGQINSASLAAVIEECHVFRELFDFMAESELESKLKQSLISASESFDETAIENLSDQILNSIVDWNAFCIPPHKFSHASLPFSSKDIRSNLKINRKEDVSSERSWNISYENAVIPTSPSDDCLARAKNVPKEQIDIVARIFEERPIVSKLYLLHKIRDKSIISNLRLILPAIAYHWKNGPWHLLWTKYGVDPRFNPEYRFLQSIELRNKMFAKELKRGKTSSDSKRIESSNTNEPVSFEFDGETLILNYLTYQYVDLKYRPLQEIVNYPAGIRAQASDKEGWYPDGTSKKLRDIMKQRWFELLRTMDLSSLPQQKLEEILEISAPSLGASSIGAEWNSLIKSSQVNTSAIQSDDESLEDVEEESDYEIFDY